MGNEGVGPNPGSLNPTVTVAGRTGLLTEDARIVPHACMPTSKVLEYFIEISFD